MISHALWLPMADGVPGTNEALSLVRAAGYHQGYGDAMVEVGRWRVRKATIDRCAEAAKAVRARVCRVVRASRMAVADGPVRLRVRCHGVPQWDAAAVFLLAKWIEDGLVDGGALADDDAAHVAEVAVGVVRHPVCDPGRGVLVEWEPVLS